MNYYHIIDSKEFELDKVIKQTSYSKNGLYYTITPLNNEIQTIRSTRTRKERGIQS